MGTIFPKWTLFSILASSQVLQDPFSHMYNIYYKDLHKPFKMEVLCCDIKSAMVTMENVKLTVTLNYIPLIVSILLCIKNKLIFNKMRSNGIQVNTRG